MVVVVATPGSTARLRPLARQLATRVRLCSLDRLSGEPVAALVASVAALPTVSPALPVAVWAGDLDELTLVRSAGHDVRVILSADPAVVAAGAVAVLDDAIDVGAHPVMPPLIRARRRERLGLPAGLVARSDTAVDLGELAVCAAAVVTGPLIVTALALGTPMVCPPADVARLALRAHEEVEVGSEMAFRVEMAARIAADDEWAARLSLGARRAAERRFDLRRVAGAVLEGLGLGLVRSQLGSGPEARVDSHLAELDTPATATIRTRVSAALAFAASQDRS